MKTEIVEACKPDNKNQQTKLITLFYDFTVKAKTDIRKVPVPESLKQHGGVVKLLIDAAENMLEQSMARERRNYFALFSKYSATIDSGKTSAEFEKELDSACSISQLTLDAVVDAYKAKLKSLAVNQNSHETKLPIYIDKAIENSAQRVESVQRHMMTSYYIYEIDTRHQAQLAAFDAKMQEEFKVLNDAKDKMEGYASTIQISSLGDLKTIWFRANHEIYSYAEPTVQILSAVPAHVQA